MIFVFIIQADNYSVRLRDIRATDDNTFNRNRIKSMAARNANIRRTAQFTAA